MTYYADAITTVRASDTAMVVTLTATTGQAGTMQLYIDGELAQAKTVTDGQAMFSIPGLSETNQWALLVVDNSTAQTDYYSTVFDTPAIYGNRIKLSLRRDPLDGYKIGDKWRVWLGDVGGDSADTMIYEADIYPGGRNACGWGHDWGYGGWGYSASNAIGWGYNWGYSWGFGIDFLIYTTQPQTRGVYPVKVTVVDQPGNSADATDTTTYLDTYARPADDLAVTSYTKNTDTLVLAFTPSEDF